MVGEAAGVCHFDDGAFRIAQQLESFPNTDRGQMVAERTSHEPPKAAGDVHWVDSDAHCELGQRQLLIASSAAYLQRAIEPDGAVTIERAGEEKAKQVDR